MAQVKVYGVREHLAAMRDKLSSLIHSCLMEALGLPPDKRFHRFFPMDPEDFLFPPDRTDRYLILEISMFEGRTLETKKKLIRLLIERISTGLAMRVEDIEITLTETPSSNWGIRGRTGDELSLPYKIVI